MRVRPAGLLAVGGLLIVVASACHQFVGIDDDARLSAGPEPVTVPLSLELPVLTTIEQVASQAVAIEIGAGGVGGSGLSTIVGPASVSIDAARSGPVMRRATFAFSGDTLIHSPLVNRANGNAGGIGFDFAPMFARIAPVISGADYAICHLETPIAPPGTPLSTYPMYGVPAEVTAGIASAGYDRCSTASNHTMDRGVAGIDATVDALLAAGLTQAGMARTPEESVVAIVDVKGIAVAHLSFTMDLNGGRLPATQPWRSNIIDAEAIIAGAHDARVRGADVVIVSLHWGTERVSNPNTFQLNVADRVTASGEVDLIVGHHAHVIQPIRQVNGHWVVFGMGNFLSNMPTGDTWPASSQDGMLVTVAIAEQADGRFVVEQPSVVPTWVDRDDDWVIHPVITDLVDPLVSHRVKSQLAVSLERTRWVVGDFVVSG